MKRTVTIGSITYAQKVRRALASRGVRARLLKTGERTGGGCAYGIEVEEGDFLTAIRLLREMGIPYRTDDLF